MILNRVFGNFDVFYKLIDIQNASSVGKIYIVKCAMPQLHPLEVSTQIVHEDFRRVHQFCSNKTDLKGNLLIHPYG